MDVKVTKTVVYVKQKIRKKTLGGVSAISTFYPVPLCEMVGFPGRDWSTVILQATELSTC